MSELGTKIVFVGGNNKNRIGGSCSVLEHKYAENRPPARIMFDLGALFAPNYCLDVDAAIPDVREYLDTNESFATKRLDAIFISHGHEDHIGGLVHLARAGYKFPHIYSSKASLELLKAALVEAGVDLNRSEWNEKYIDENGIERRREIFFEVADGDKVRIMNNEKKPLFTGVEIEPFNVSHSTIGALGFHTLTTIDGNVEAGILHPGDFHLGKIRVGDGFNENSFTNLLKRKPVTHAILDSTSSSSSDEYVVTHEEAVANTVEIINQHPEKQVITAVISRSVQNLAIDLDAARITGRKIFLDGYWTKIAFKAMQNSGIHEFDDMVFRGSAAEYKSKFSETTRYIITSGAFAESKKGAKSGLYKMSEQEKIRQTKNKNKSKNNKKLGHPDFDVDSNTLILARQRCIEEINGKQVRAMYNRLASLGAVIIANEAETPLGNYKTAKMQRSGHASKSEIIKLVNMILSAQKRPADVTFIPTHGNPQQLINTAKAVKSVGGGFYFANNLDVIKVNKDETSKIDELTSNLWIGVCETSDNTSSVKEYTYFPVDENFVVKGEPFKKVVVKTPNRKNNFFQKSEKHSR